MINGDTTSLDYSSHKFWKVWTRSRAEARSATFGFSCMPEVFCNPCTEPQNTGLLLLSHNNTENLLSNY